MRKCERVCVCVCVCGQSVGSQAKEVVLCSDQITGGTVYSDGIDRAGVVRWPRGFLRVFVSVCVCLPRTLTLNST